MKSTENGKWNLSDLVKNPSKQVFDKKIREIEKKIHTVRKAKKDTKLIHL